MWTGIWILRWPLFLLLATAPSGLKAEETSDFPFKFGGFGTLGWARSSLDTPEFRRDLSQPAGTGTAGSFQTDSRLGLQGDAALGSEFRATVQLVSKLRYDNTFTPDLTWAFLAWTPTSEVQVRAGRLGFDVFVQSDSRDVGYAMPWVRPPVECFGTLPINSLDGVDATASFDLSGERLLRIKGYVGEATGHLPLDKTQAYNLQGSRLGGCFVELQDDDWRVRLAFAKITFHRNLPGPYMALQEGLKAFSAQLGDPAPAEAAESLSLENQSCRYYSLGGEYALGPLRAQGTLARYLCSSDVSPDNWSGFLSLAWRANKLGPYLLYSRVVTERAGTDLSAMAQLPIPQAQVLAAGYAAALAANANDQTSLGAGLRWDFAPKACLKLQADRIATWRSSGLWVGPLPNWTGQATVLSAAVDFTF